MYRVSDAQLGSTSAAKIKELLPDLPIEVQYQIIAAALKEESSGLLAGPYYPADFRAHGDYLNFAAVVDDASLSFLALAYSQAPPSTGLVQIQELLKFPKYDAYHRTALRYASVSTAYASEVREVLRTHVSAATDADAEARTVCRTQFNEVEKVEVWIMAALTSQPATHLGNLNNQALSTRYREVLWERAEAIQNVEFKSAALFVIEGCEEIIAALADGGDAQKSKAWLFDDEDGT